MRKYRQTEVPIIRIFRNFNIALFLFLLIFLLLLAEETKLNIILISLVEPIFSRAIKVTDAALFCNSYQ